MVNRCHAFAIAACALLLVGTMPAVAGSVSYDFSADAAAGVATPATIGQATFSSPSDPGAYVFGPNAGLFSDLGASVLSSAGTVATLDITFSAPQTGVGFNSALGDFLGSGGNDILTVTPDAGSPEMVTASLVGSDFYPQGSFDLTNATPFSFVAISSAYAIVIADLISAIRFRSRGRLRCLASPWRASSRRAAGVGDLRAGPLALSATTRRKQRESSRPIERGKGESAPFSDPRCGRLGSGRRLRRASAQRRRGRPEGSWRQAPHPSAATSGSSAAPNTSLTSWSGSSGPAAMGYSRVLRLRARSRVLRRGGLAPDAPGRATGIDRHPPPRR